MANDWVRLHLPGWQHIGRYALWGAGRVTFSLWLFSLHGVKTACKIGIHVVDSCLQGTNVLLRVYDQLPHMGQLATTIETTAKVLPNSDPEYIITDLVQALAGKHCMIIGNTGTGKSTIAQWLAYQVGGTVTVYDADAAPDEWQGLTVIGRKGDFEAITTAMSGDLLELQRRVELRGEHGDKALAGLESVLIAEEFPLLVSEVDVATEWLIKHGNRGRKPKRFVIALSQDDSVKSLGIEGQGNARNNFVFVRLGKYAVKHAQHLKDEVTVEWLKSGKYRCMVEDTPCQLPDLSQFRAVTQQLHMQPRFTPSVTAETPVETGFQPVETSERALPDEVARAVKVALQMGIAESRVIKEILGCEGSRYQQGKALLQQLRQYE
ncbi:MAG: ATP-binding protein [Scytonema sp. PMC 1069.18]|nr:ATP-binding protein [Scytonema sp. PMC 1069.18]MEC4887690.1 ATP-binding protein [Scytonema sp. PMC 1070.18]